MNASMTSGAVHTGHRTELEPAGRPLPLWYSLLLAGVLVTAVGYGLHQVKPQV
jgi:hypothetical protein